MFSKNLCTFCEISNGKQSSNSRTLMFKNPYFWIKTNIYRKKETGLYY